MQKNLKKLLLCALCSVSICVLGALTDAKVNETKNNITAYNCATNVVKDDISETDSVLMKKKKDSLKQEMVDEMSRFVTKQAPSAHPSIPTHLVETALEYDIDLAFMAAQTQLETNFGTAGMGRPTSRYSLFGVCSRYNSYQEAIDGYGSLMRRKYLVNGKTEADMLKCFVNKDGYRYAKEGYEIKLGKYYSGVLSKTKLKEIQAQYKSIEV